MPPGVAAAPDAFPGLPKVTEQPSVLAVAQRLGVTPAQVGLAWLLAQAVNVLLIPGTSRLSHLEQNLAVAEVHLSAEDLAELSSPAG